MAKIFPFRGLTYDPGKIGDFSRVVAPPYDVISPEHQAELYDRSPRNVVRIDFCRNADPYETVPRRFREWQEDGTLVPEDEQTQDEIYDIICQELSYYVFRDESRAKMVEVIRGLEARGAEACILGCTEIELLVQEKHVPGFPLLPSAEIHIQAAANVLLGKLELEDVLP